MATTPISVPTRRTRYRRLAVQIAGILLLATGAYSGVAWFFFWQGERALAAHDPERADVWLSRLATIRGNGAAAEFLWARTARKLGRMEETHQHLMRAWKLGYSVDALEREQWLTEASSGQLSKAEPYLAKLLKDPREDGAEICEAFVIGYLLAYRPVEAGRVLDAWKADFPGDALPDYYWARIHLLELNWEKGEAALRSALAREPGNVPAALALAETLMELQKPAEALEWFRRTQHSQVYGVRARLGLAECCKRLGQTAEARSLLQQILSESPDLPEALYQLGQSELEAGNYEQALQLFERAGSKGGPKSVEILYGRIRALYSLRRQDEARALQERLRLMRDARTRAQELIEKLHDDPYNSELRFAIGKAYLESGWEAEGMLWIRSVLQFDRQHAGALQEIAAFAKQLRSE